MNDEEYVIHLTQGIQELVEINEALTESRDALRLIASNKAQALILAKEENARLRAVLDLDPWFVGREAWKRYTDIALKGETP